MPHAKRYLRRENSNPFVIEMDFNRHNFDGTRNNHFNILASCKVALCKYNNDDIKSWLYILLPIQWETLINLGLLICMLKKELLLRMVCLTEYTHVSIYVRNYLFSRNRFCQIWRKNYFQQLSFSVLNFEVSNMLCYWPQCCSSQHYYYSTALPTKMNISLDYE